MCFNTCILVMQMICYSGTYSQVPTTVSAMSTISPSGKDVCELAIIIYVSLLNVCT